MKRSEKINELTSALAKAQGQITAAPKDAENSHFKSEYATLDSVWDACRGPLSLNGLAVVQSPSITTAGAVLLTTLLAHTSGQWLESALELLPKDRGPHSVGSAITYGRRYALMAIVGIAPAGADEGSRGDDDGNAAHGPRQSNPSPVRPVAGATATPKPTHPSPAQIKYLFTVMSTSKIPEELLRHYVKTEFGIDSTKELNLAQFDQTLKAMEGGLIV